MIDPDQFSHLQRDVADIKTALIGNKSLGVDGMVEDVRELKEWRKKLTVRIAFISGAAATVWEGIKFAGEYLTNNHKP